MKVTGLKSLKSVLEKKLKKTEKAHVRGLLKAGLFLQRESQELCPVDKGPLVNSARTWVEPPGGAGFASIVFVGYGSGLTYAVLQHEDLDFHHAPGKQAKFLEQPAREKRKEMVAIYAEELKTP